MKIKYCDKEDCAYYHEVVVDRLTFSELYTGTVVCLFCEHSKKLDNFTKKYNSVSKRSYD